MSAPRRISHAQNGEDIRVWRAFREYDQRTLRYVDVGANEPRHLSITASLHDLGWRGVLIEADPQLAADLRVHRPDDTVVELAAAGEAGDLIFHRVPGTGLGTLDAREADEARQRGFDVEQVVVRTESLDVILDGQGMLDVHFMTIDVEGAESIVLEGLSLLRHRPWVLCIEAVYPGTSTPSHGEWEPRLLACDYRFATFDGVNRWYVAGEHAELLDEVAIPFNAIDAGEHGWIIDEHARAQEQADRAKMRRAWQRELILNDIRGEVPRAEYERQIDELRTALIGVEGSRAFRYAHKAARLGRGVVFRARRALDHLPEPVRAWRVRRRHLKHVTVNMGHLTDPAYLGNPPADVVGWVTEDGLPAGPEGGFELGPLTPQGAEQARQWLENGPYDSDAILDRRTDNHGDELGRTMAALRLRLRIADGPASPTWAGGALVLFDARSLQSPAFGNRGIGRFARAALDGARATVGDERLVLLVDRGLEELPPELAGSCRQITGVEERSVPLYGTLVQPSPMTAAADPLLPLLHSDARKIAVVFDFIPMHYPTVYLRHYAARAEYAAALDGLRLYDEFVCISALTRNELLAFLGRPVEGPGAVTATVAWPRDVLPTGSSTPPAHGQGPIVVMTGDEPRKNTFGALAAIGAATAGGDDPRDVVVLGMAGQETRVHHWSIAAAIRPGEVRTVSRLSDQEMHALLAGSSLVVVASFDEGLSLPVIEALRSGAPVVAADIPAHRELIGAGSYLADPRSPASLAAAIRRHSGRASTQQRQMRTLTRHPHEALEDVIGRLAARPSRAATVDLPAASVHVAGRAPRIGIGTPWAPQRTGVADFSTTTTIELARLCDVTVYATQGADVAGTTPDDVRITPGRIDDVIARGSDDDVFVSVVGNSHFHLPFLEATERVESVVVSHDTRLVEMYMALRGRGGVEQLMLRGTGHAALSPSLDDQIDDMRLLENAGFWEVARRSRMLVLHTPSAAGRIAAETGVTPRLLPFANQRAPLGPVTERMRRDARDRLGFDEDDFAGTVHIATFGYVDVRTKMTDVVIEAAAWLSQWGHRVSLHLAGAATPSEVDSLTRRAQEAGIENFRITGFLSDAQFRDYLLAVDMGVQLRISPLLGVSGPLSDLSAYGTAAVASSGLCVDVDTPGYVDRLPDDVSPVMVAEALEYRLAHPIPHAEREAMRLDYVDRKSPQRYAQQMLGLLLEVIGGRVVTYVGIDIEQFVRDPYGSGIQRVLQYLAKEWPTDRVQADFVVPMGDGFGLLTPTQAFSLLSIPFTPQERGSDLRQLVSTALEEAEPLQVRPGDLLAIYDAWLLPEVTYLPSVLERFELFARCVPTVMVGYDTLPMSEPGNYRFKPGTSAWVSEYFRHLATADEVVCISSYARDSILGRLRRDPGLPIGVAHPGGDHLPVRPSQAPQRPVFARLGTLEARKRPVEILRAFQEAVASHGVEADLLFIGGPSASDEAINAAVRAAVDAGEPVLWMQGASDESVHDLVNRSSAFLSIGTEGYGIPVLEAVRLGTPVLFDGVQPAGDLMVGSGARRVPAMTHDDLVRLFADHAVAGALDDLRTEAAAANVPTWAEFTESVADACTAL